jgi:hypothetical protein
VTTAVDEKQAAKEAIKARAKDMEAREKALNEGRTGKGLRVMLGLTRGKNPQEVKYEAFDESQADTLPKTLAEFMELTGTKEESTILEFLVDGFNSAQYTNASDPVAEHIEASWPDDVKKAFKLAVKNYAAAVNVSIDDAVALIKPGIVASQKK